MKKEVVNSQNYECLTNIIANCETCNQGGSICYGCITDYYLFSSRTFCDTSCPTTECA